MDTLLPLVVAFAALATVYLGRPVLIPAMLSIFLAILLEPWVAWLHTRGLGRHWGAAICVMGFFLVGSGAGWGLYFVISETILIIPQCLSRIGAPSLPPLKDWGQLLWAGIDSAFPAVSMGIFVPFLLFFLLLEKTELHGKWNRLVGAHCRTDWLDQEVPRMVSAYFLDASLIGLAMAALQGLLFAALGLRNPFGLGLVTGLLNIIPFIGLFLALALPVAQGLVQSMRPWTLLVMGVCLWGLHMFAGNFVIPRFIASKVRLNSFCAILGTLFWWWAWGAVGFLLALPLTALVRILLESNSRTAALAELMANNGSQRRS